MQQHTDETAIRRRMNKFAEAIRAADLHGLMSNYAPDIISFDAGPLLRQSGAEAKMKNWKEVFTIYRPPLGYDFRDLTISVSGDLAFAHSVNRLAGTLDGGKTNGTWVRFTACLRKINGEWLMVHDHVSVPADPASGRALFDLEPQDHK